MKLRQLSKWKTLLLAAALLVVAPLLLFAFNGMILARGETPLAGVTSHVAGAAFEDRASGEITILAFNIAKCFIHRGGIEFDTEENVDRRLNEIAQVIRSANPDLVFLSEAVFECGPRPVNQVVELAEAAGMHAWAFGENYNFGLPLYRMVGGNAILSRWPLEAVANPSLAGRRPFYITRNNRRVLWCRLQLGGTPVLLGSIHTDSYVLDNNLRQTGQILDYCQGQPAILAGDFNAQPHESSIQEIQACGRFSGDVENTLTFPADKPEQRLDYIFAPASWTLLESKVIETQASDHLPVLSRFKVALGD